MIEAFTKAWFANLHTMREKFTAKHPDDYKEVVRSAVQMLADASTEYDKPDPERIHEIDDGDYQGTHVYVIGAQGYQPSRYWYVKVSYGSCSGCDTLQAISEYSSDPPNSKQVSEYMTLALHIVQGLREMGDSEA
jgi:hypothetical protein